MSTMDAAASAARDAWESAVGSLERLAASAGLPTTSASSTSLERLVRPPLERTAAAWRWGSFAGAGPTIPLPAPSFEDPRMLLTALGLVRVLYEEFEQHASHNASQPPSLASSPEAALAASLPLPPVTLALAAAAVARYFAPVPLRDVCLSPYCVLDRRQTYRLASAVLAHYDAPHLLSNLAALLPDAAALERRYGSVALAGDVAVLTGLSGGLFVCWAVVERELLHRPTTFYAVGAVGMSSLAFALQVVNGVSQAGRTVSLLGLPLPAQFGWAAQLALTSLAAPDTSFAGHMAGVLAGIVHAYLLRPALRYLLRGPGQPPGPNGPRPRFYGAGTTGGRPVATPSNGQRPANGRGGLRSALAGALSQLALAGAAVGLYVLAAQRRQQQPLSSWRWR